LPILRHCYFPVTNETEIEKRADFLLNKAKEIWKAEEIEIENASA
jgi:hypothetical protein